MSLMFYFKKNIWLLRIIFSYFELPPSNDQRAGLSKSQEDTIFSENFSRFHYGYVEDISAGTGSSAQCFSRETH